MVKTTIRGASRVNLGLPRIGGCHQLRLDLASWLLEDAAGRRNPSQPRELHQPKHDSDTHRNAVSCRLQQIGGRGPILVATVIQVVCNRAVSSPRLRSYLLVGLLSARPCTHNRRNSRRDGRRDGRRHGRQPDLDRCHHRHSRPGQFVCRRRPGFPSYTGARQPKRHLPVKGPPLDTQCADLQLCFVGYWNVRLTPSVGQIPTQRPPGLLDIDGHDPDQGSRRGHQRTPRPDTGDAAIGFLG